MLQENPKLVEIGTSIEKKILSNFKSMLKKDREKYEKFFDALGTSIKVGIYDNFGQKKDMLKDLVLFKSSTEDEKYTTLAEYKERVKKDQKEIYYATGSTIDSIKLLSIN